MSSASTSSVATANRTYVKRKTTFTDRDDIVEGMDGDFHHFQVYRGMSPTSSNRLELRMKDLEETVQEEREGRLRAERELNELSFQVDNLSERLEEADGFNITQSELSRRREMEYAKLKKDFDTLVAERELIETSGRKRHQDALNDLNQQLDNSNRLRAKCEQEKQQIIAEIESMSVILDTAGRAKVAADMRAGELEEQLRRLKLQLDDQCQQLQEANGLKARLGQENVELHRHLQELDTNNAALAKAKTSLQQDLEETKMKLDEETRVRNQLAIQVTNLQLDLDNAGMRIDEEASAAENAHGQMQRALFDLQQVKAKHEKEMAVLMEQVDETRRKMAARIAEVEDTAEQARSRTSKLEKERNRLQVQINEVMADSEATRNQAMELAKRLKQADHINTELQHRIDELTNETQSASAEIQRLQADNGRLRAAHDGVVVKLDTATRESKQLSELLRQSESGSKELRNQIQELLVIKIQLEGDREGLSAEVNDLREALREAQTRLDATNGTINQLKSDAERRLKDKDNELDTIRKSNQRAIEELQRTVIEIESKYKTELSRLRKKFEPQIAEYEQQLETLSRSNAELARANKALSSRIKEIEIFLNDERQSGEEARQAAAILERKRIALQAELEDVGSHSEAADRARKNIEMELGETQQRVADLSMALTSTVSEKRRFDAEMAGVRGELEDAMRERGEALDRAIKLQAEFNRVLEDLRQAEEIQRVGEGQRQRMEAELRDLAARLEHTENVAFREGKRLVAKLQSKLVDLEAELENAVRRERDLANENRKMQRLLAEQKALSDEDHRLAEQTAEQNQILQQRVKTLKRQLEEAEEVVHLTLNKYRKATHLLQEAERGQVSSSSAADTGRLLVVPSGTNVKNNRSMSVTREVTRVVRV